MRPSGLTVAVAVEVVAIRAEALFYSVLLAEGFHFLHGFGELCAGRFARSPSISHCVPYLSPLPCAFIIAKTIEKHKGDIGEELGKDLAEFVENLFGNFFGCSGHRVEPGNL